ncbi:nuclear transport factor 2 family protein [Lentzea sp. NPDC059081]|uniref:nuclear transport factor 2 family protein n=1 Tax=Lentzea sp. NPDC059081 TaxID=3346719 RepID=UPI00369B8478
MFEYVVSVPGYPRRVEGRHAVAELYRSYGRFMRLRSSDDLDVHWDPAKSVVVLEYRVHGEAVHTGRAYDNQFVSVITIENRKVVRWRDYLDPVAIFNASGWPTASAQQTGRRQRPEHVAVMADPARHFQVLKP